MNVTLLFGLLLAVAVGFLLGWMSASLRNSPLKAELEQKKIEATQLSASVQKLTGDLIAERDAKSKLDTDLARLGERLVNEQRQSAEKLKLLDEAKSVLSLQFKALAGEILDNNSAKFNAAHKENLTGLLTPIQKQLTEFREKVEKSNLDTLTTSAELKTKISDLAQLNQNLSEQALNLTKALRGSSKTQGDWGEFILEQILESSGLRKDIEYRVQESLTNEESKQARPDVILNLPGGRHLIIDSKVTLPSYTDYANASDDVGRAVAQKQLIQSMQEHIKGLSAKKYQTLYQLQTLDFVILFVPIEQAFLLALTNEESMWRDAYNRNVLLVSPTTLMFVVRTVANLWRQESQTRRVKEIVKSAEGLYDKFTDFVKDLQDVGARLDQAQKSYDSAFRKLSKGEKGTLISRIEGLRKLGIKPTKQLPQDLLPDEDFPAEEPEPLALAAEGREE
jgi:DNA recombination protein RmuC